MRQGTNKLAGHCARTSQLSMFIYRREGILGDLLGDPFLSKFRVQSPTARIAGSQPGFDPGRSKCFVINQTELCEPFYSVIGHI